MDNDISNFRNTRLFWVLMLVAGLVLESCLIAAGLGVWMSGRDREDGRVVAVGGSTPTWEAPAPSPAVEASPTAETPVATEEDATATPEASPTPTATPPPRLENPPPGKIVYVCYDGRFDQICLMDAGGSNRRQLTDIEATNFYPSFSPDGNQIVFSSNRDGNFEIYMMDIRGENIVQLTDNLGNAFAPAISPKGNRIAFTLATGSSQNIWIMRLDGSNVRNLTESNSDIDPSWSPGANYLAFASSRDGNTALYYMEAADGGKVERVTRRGFVTGGRNDWSPDGSRLVFYAGETGDHDLYTIRIDGTDLEQLTDGGDNLGPSFSPDGEWVTFTSFRDGNNEIYIQNLQDGTAYRLTYEPTSDWQPRWGP